MVSAFTRRGADVTVRALEAGAFDFVTKPSCDVGGDAVMILRQQLGCKFRLFLARRNALTAPSTTMARPAVSQPSVRSVGGETLRAVLVAASTGGPRALQTLLPDLCARLDLPVFVVQHMPAGFTRSLAEHLAMRVPGRVIEALDGDPVRPSTVYIAPGDRHLVLRSERGQLVTGLNELPPENGSRPSADVLFRSAATVLGGAALAVVLTGMLNDGTAGLRPLKRSGAYAIAQDEATSVVWGMPGSVVHAGLADEVLPLSDIAAAIETIAAGRRRR